MPTRHNTTNSGQNASPVHPSDPDTTPLSGPTDLAQSFPENPRGSPMRAHLPVDIATPSPPPAPAPFRFRHVDSHPIRSPWSTEPNTNLGLLDESQRCSHQDVVPGFCRNNADRRGFACQRCRSEHCSLHCLPQRGPVEELDCALEAELARERGAQQLEQERQPAMNAARLREAGAADDAEQDRIAGAGPFELESLDPAAADRQQTGSRNAADVENSD
ncbi:hypothetical protein ColLi_03158 [Colletotrichum liriopes]|uniref:Uncharacterized protein n=1 Tax=Colletotrichum liriopes TaxID=708192 RepID=A0AA37LPG7_9PEZI|nr:hypothetical protein ColLi_03158 [Colletotrichum liriopes]